LASANTKELMQEGIKLVREGRNAQAYDIFRQVAAQDANNEFAWIWVSVTSPNRAEKRQALNEALRINPGSQHAAEALRKLDQEEPAVTAAPPPPFMGTQPMAAPPPPIGNYVPPSQEPDDLRAALTSTPKTAKTRKKNETVTTANNSRSPKQGRPRPLRFVFLLLFAIALTLAIFVVVLVIVPRFFPSAENPQAGVVETPAATPGDTTAAVTTAGLETTVAGTTAATNTTPSATTAASTTPGVATTAAGTAANATTAAATTPGATTATGTTAAPATTPGATTAAGTTAATTAGSATTAAAGTTSAATPATTIVGGTSGQPLPSVSPVVSTAQVAAALQSAKNNQNAGNVPAAIATYQSILSYDSRNIDANLGLGDLYLTTPRSALPASISAPITEAVRLFRTVTSQAPNWAGGHAKLGQALRVQGDVQAAIVAYNRSLELDPNGPERWLALAALYDQSNQPDQARLARERAGVITPVPPTPTPTPGPSPTPGR
jgi:hypothetical protein